MGLFQEVELIIPPKKQNTTIKVKPLYCYDSIREKIDEGNTLTANNPVINEHTTPKTKVSIGFVIKLKYFF